MPDGKSIPCDNWYTCCWPLSISVLVPIRDPHWLVEGKWENTLETATPSKTAVNFSIPFGTVQSSSSRESCLKLTLICHCFNNFLLDYTNIQTVSRPATNRHRLRRWEGLQTEEQGRKWMIWGEVFHLIRSKVQQTKQQQSVTIYFNEKSISSIE